VGWEDLVQQMRKYGGRMILGTQSMASLRRQNPEIPEIILSGVYSLFAFALNGDDAAYISSKELSGEMGGPTADTLISLDPHKAYVRLERQAGGLSRPFYFESEPPPEFDQLLADRIRNLRANYCLPYESARQNALEMLMVLEKDEQRSDSMGLFSTRHDPPDRAQDGTVNEIVMTEEWQDFIAGFQGPLQDKGAQDKMVIRSSNPTKVI
jgi:hypothetical protein